MNILFVGIGGFLGSCARYAIIKAFQPLGILLPPGTLISNITAGFLIGLIIGWERQTAPLPERTRLCLTTGLLGGLSTFSSFSMETVQLFENGRVVLAAGNVMLNVGLSLTCVLLGITASKLITVHHL